MVTIKKIGTGETIGSSEQNKTQPLAGKTGLNNQPAQSSEPGVTIRRISTGEVLGTTQRKEPEGLSLPTLEPATPARRTGGFGDTLKRIGQGILSGVTRRAANTSEKLGTVMDLHGGTAMRGVYEDQVQMLDQEIAALERLLRDPTMTPQEILEAQEALTQRKQQRDIYTNAIRSNENTGKGIHETVDQGLKYAQEQAEKSVEGTSGVGRAALSFVPTATEIALDVGLNKLLPLGANKRFGLGYLARAASEGGASEAEYRNKAGENYDPQAAAQRGMIASAGVAAGSLASAAVNKGVLGLLKNKGLQNYVIPNVLKGGLNATAFAGGDVAMRELARASTEDEYTPDWKQVGGELATAFAFGVVTEFISTAAITGQNKAYMRQLNQNLEKGYEYTKSIMQDPRATVEQRAAGANSVMQMADELDNALNNMQVVGAQKEVNAIRDFLASVRAEMTGYLADAAPQSAGNIGGMTGGLATVAPPTTPANIQQPTQPTAPVQQAPSPAASPANVAGMAATTPTAAPAQPAQQPAAPQAVQPQASMAPAEKRNTAPAQQEGLSLPSLEEVAEQQGRTPYGIKYDQAGEAAIRMVAEDITAGKSADQLMQAAAEAHKSYQALQASIPYGVPYTEDQMVTLHLLDLAESFYESAAQNPQRTLEQITEVLKSEAPALPANNQIGGMNNEQSAGAEPAVAGPAANELLDGGQKRDVDLRAGGQAGRVAEGAEQRPAVAGIEQVQTANQRQDLARHLRGEKVSSRSLGLSAGTDTANLTVVPAESWDEQMRETAQRVERDTGKSVTYVLGRIQIKDANGNIRRVRGVYSPAGIIIQADNLGVNINQIADHEIYHDLSENDPGLDAKVEERIREQFTPEQFDKILDKYIDKLNGIISLSEDATPDELEAAIKEIKNEIFADAYAGINAFGAHAETLGGAVNDVTNERLGMRGGEYAAATDRTTGPPERYSYGGRNANGADLDALAEAERLEMQGVDDETIRQMTGWHRGMEGKWRFEIDDSGMKYRRGGDAYFRSAHPEYAEYQGLMERMLGGELLPEADETRLQELDDTWGREYGRLSERVDRGNATLADIIEHPELFRNYPQLRFTRVRFEDLPRGVRGQYYADGNEITLDNSLRGAPEDTLVHEVQHAIQNAEGFTNGSSVDSWRSTLAADQRRSIEEADAKVRRIFASMPEDVKNKVRAINRANADQDWDTAIQLENELYDEGYGDLFAAYEDAHFDRLAAHEKQKNADLDAEAVDKYLNTAGEIEARDVTARRGMTPEERRATAPARADERTVYADDENGLSLPSLEQEPETLEQMEERLQVLEEEYQEIENRRKAFQEQPEYKEFMAAISAPREGSRFAKSAELDAAMKKYAEWEKASGLSGTAKRGEELRGEMRTLRGQIEEAKRQALEQARQEYRAQFTPEAAAKYATKAARKFGTTTRFDRAGYLTTNGALLDFSQGQGYRVQDHREIAEILDFLPDDHEYSDGMIEFMNLGNIRMQNYGIDISKKPNMKQVPVLRRFFNSLDGEVTVDFSKENGDSAGSIDYPEGTRSDRILADIDRYFKTGEVPELSETAQFHTRYSVDDEGLTEPEKKTKAEKPAKREKKKPPKESLPIIAKRELRQDMLNLFSIPAGQRAELGEIIDQYADRILRQGNLGQRDMDAFFDQMYAEGVMSVAAEDYYQDARRAITGRRIYVNDIIKGDFGDEWNDFRKRAFAAGLYLVNDRTAPGVDVVNAELSSLMPGTFDEDTYDMKGVLERAVQLAEEGKDQKMSLAEYTAMLAEQEYVSEDEILSNIERQMDWLLRTFAQKAQLELTLRDRTGVKLAQASNKSKQRVENEKAREAQRRAKDRERRREMEQRQRDRRELQELQQKTLKQLQWLSKNRYRAPEQLRAAWDEVLGDIDIYAVSAANEMNWSNKYGATWRDLADMYKDAQKNDPNFLPSKELERIVTRLDADKIEDMDPAALADLYKAAVGLRTEFYNRNNVINDEQHRLFSEVYTDAKGEIGRAASGYTGKKLDKFLNMEQLTPMNFLERMGGWDTDGAWYSMARQLEQGEREMRDYRVKAERQLEDFLREHEEWVKKADGQGKDAIWYELEVPQLLELGMGDKPIFGPTVKVYMTPAQKVHLYLESKSYDNLRHMVGGRTFADKKLYSEGKRQEAFAQGRTVKLAPETVKKIVSNLTPEEQELAKVLEDYYNNFAAKKINEKSNILYGYDKAMSKNYAPIYTNRNYVNSEIGVFDTTAEGVGNLKARQYSKNPSYNIGAFDAFERHIDQTARFVGMAIPARNWQTLLNYREQNNSMGDVITHKWGEEAKRYITDLLTTLQGGGRAGKKTLEGAADKLLSNYVTAVFGANPGIVFKQAASFPQFAAALGWENAPSVRQMLHVDENIINAYTSELAYRQLGYATPETAQLKNNPNFLDSNKATRFLLRGGAITAMDAGTVKRAWPWAENKVRREYPELEVGTEEQIRNGESPFYRKVAEEFENAVSMTQPMYDEMHRPEIMKNGSGIQRAFTMFKTVPLQQYNSLRRSFGELQAAKQKAERANDTQKPEAEEQEKAAAKKAGAAVTATLASVLMLEAVEMLNQLAKNRGKNYRNDEGELTAGSVGERLARNATGDLAGMVIGGDELTDILANWFLGEKWYGIEIPGGEQLNDIIDAAGGAAGTIQKIITEGANILANGGDLGEYFRRNAGDYAGAAKELAEKLAMYLGGLPVQNVEKYILGAMQTISPELYAGMEDIFDTPTKNDLKGLSGDALATRADHILKARGVEISDETAAALAELYEAGQKTSIPPDTPSSITVNGEDRKLNAYQRQTYDLVWSANVERALDDLTSSSIYRQATPEEQAKMIDKVYDYAAEKAKGVLFDDYETKSSTAKADDMLGAGSSIAEWAAWSVSAKDEDRATQYEQVLASDMSESAKLAAIGNLIGTDMETDAGNPTQWAKLNTAVKDGHSVEEAIGLMQSDNLDDYMKWRESDAKAAGVKAGTYIEFRNTLSGTTADKDASGKTISGSKKKKVLAYINSLDLTAAQKDALYYDAGYTQSTIGDAPWHGGELQGLSLPTLGSQQQEPQGELQGLSLPKLGG